MNYGKLTAGTTKTAIDTAKPSEKGEIITYLSRMGDVLKQIADWGKFVIALGGVYVIRNRYKTDIVLREKFFGQAAHLNVVAPQAAEVLHKDRCRFALLELLDHIHEAGAIHGHAGNAIIQEMHQISVAFFLCHLGEQFFLITNAVTLTFQIIVTGKPLVEEGCHITGFFIVRLFHKSSFLGQSDNNFSCVL